MRHVGIVHHNLFMGKKKKNVGSLSGNQSPDTFSAFKFTRETTENTFIEVTIEVCNNPEPSVPITEILRFKRMFENSAIEMVKYCEEHPVEQIETSVSLYSLIAKELLCVGNTKELMSELERACFFFDKDHFESLDFPFLLYPGLTKINTWFDSIMHHIIYIPEEDIKAVIDECVQVKDEILRFFLAREIIDMLSLMANACEECLCPLTETQMCSKCKRVWYCGPECQQKAWSRHHKKICNKY